MMSVSGDGLVTCLGEIPATLVILIKNEKLKR